MSTSEDYGPCRVCGELTDSGVCGPGCVAILEADKRARWKELFDECVEDMVLLVAPDPLSTDEDDTVVVCSVCGDVDGHTNACAIGKRFAEIR